MQGSYKTNGLPRPYYMKPSSKRSSAYNKMPRQFFYTSSRKLSGYIVMLFIFGLCMYMVSQDLKDRPDPVYDLVDPSEKSGENNGDVGKLVDTSKGEDRADEKAALASNEKIVVEAPKGGMVNEGPLVGNDEGLAIDGKPRNKNNAHMATAPTVKGKAPAGANAANAANAADNVKASNVKASNNKLSEEELRQKLLEVDTPRKPVKDAAV